MNGLKNLAIIPARGGSKRIPRKNTREFLGKPVISYSIGVAMESHLFGMIVVSTDDQEIAEISRKYGAAVPFLRSQENSDDHATLSDVIDEVQSLLHKSGQSFDNICCILPTAPLITVDVLKTGLNLLISGEFSSVRPVVPYSFPVQRAFKMNRNNVEFLFPEHQNTRSQDLENIVHDAGQFYWMKADKGLKDNNRGAFIISEIQAQDIDNENDWKMAEIKYKLINTM